MHYGSIRPNECMHSGRGSGEVVQVSCTADNVTATMHEWCSNSTDNTWSVASGTAGCYERFAAGSFNDQSMRFARIWCDESQAPDANQRMHTNYFTDANCSTPHPLAYTELSIPMGKCHHNDRHVTRLSPDGKTAIRHFHYSNSRSTPCDAASLDYMEPTPIGGCRPPDYPKGNYERVTAPVEPGARAATNWPPDASQYSLLIECMDEACSVDCEATTAWPLGVCHDQSKPAAGNVSRINGRLRQCTSNGGHWTAAALYSSSDCAADSRVAVSLVPANQCFNGSDPHTKWEAGQSFRTTCAEAPTGASAINTLPSVATVSWSGKQSNSSAPHLRFGSSLIGFIQEDVCLPAGLLYYAAPRGRLTLAPSGHENDYVNFTSYTGDACTGDIRRVDQYELRTLLGYYGASMWLTAKSLSPPMDGFEALATLPPPWGNATNEVASSSSTGSGSDSSSSTASGVSSSTGGSSSGGDDAGSSSSRGDVSSTGAASLPLSSSTVADAVSASSSSTGATGATSSDANGGSLLVADHSSGASSKLTAIIAAVVVIALLLLLVLLALGVWWRRRSRSAYKNFDVELGETALVATSRSDESTASAIQASATD